LLGVSGSSAIDFDFDILLDAVFLTGVDCTTATLRLVRFATSLFLFGDDFFNFIFSSSPASAFEGVSEIEGSVDFVFFRVDVFFES
jgi:hypothetical protein